MVNLDLEKLKKAMHPEEPMNIIDQCAIVTRAVSTGGDFPFDNRALAKFLEASVNKIYKMNRVTTSMIPSAKELFRGSKYQSSTAYMVATLTKEEQENFVKAATGEGNEETKVGGSTGTSPPSSP